MPKNTTTATDLAVERAPLETVTYDFYRNIHKGIRAEMFAVTRRAGNVDPADDAGVTALADRWRNLSVALVRHAEHEEVYVQAAVLEHAPSLADRVISDHRELEPRATALELLADRAASASPDDRRLALHRLYLGLAGFTSAYMVHQEYEELEVMPALSAAVGVDELIGIDMTIVASLTPEEIVYDGTLVLPAMNVEDRVELIGGMREGMPPEAFAGIWGLVESVLEPADFAQLAARLRIN